MTRRKHRAEGELLLQQLEALQLPRPRILELWCGGGRFLSYLKEHYQGDFDYIGVDFSQGLLDCAQKDHPEATFICEDMVSYLQGAEQESFDAIVACASFQHLPTLRERELSLALAYTTLTYEGVLLFINRSFSDRFLKKYTKACAKAFFLFLLSFGQKDARDVFVPRKEQGKVFHRYYHIFGLKELRSLTELAGFLISKLCYLDAKGKETLDRRISKNSLLVAKKGVEKI